MKYLGFFVLGLHSGQDRRPLRPEKVHFLYFIGVSLTCLICVPEHCKITAQDSLTVTLSWCLGFSHMVDLLTDFNIFTK